MPCCGAIWANSDWPDQSSSCASRMLRLRELKRLNLLGCFLRRHRRLPMAGKSPVSEGADKNSDNAHGQNHRPNPVPGKSDLNAKGVGNGTGLHAFQTQRAFIRTNGKQPVHRQRSGTGFGAFATIDAGRDIAHYMSWTHQTSQGGQSRLIKRAFQKYLQIGKVHAATDDVSKESQQYVFDRA